MRVTSIIEYLQKQHAVDQINIAECLLTHGDTIDAILEESGCDDCLLSPTSPKDAFFMTLTVLKHYQTWEMQATHFKFKAPTFQKLITLVIAVIESIFFRHFVKMPSMTDLRNKDAVLPTTPRHYFSGKHKLYGLKVEASVSTEILCVDMSAHLPGLMKDLTMLMDRFTVHRMSLANVETEMAINDVGETFDDQIGYSTGLVTKGYVGIMHHTRRIHSKKKPTGGALDTDDVNRSKRVSSDKVVLWKVSYATFTWNHIFDGFLRLTFTLTKHQVTLMPLRSNDGATYRSVLACYQAMSKTYSTSTGAMKLNGASRRHRAERVLKGSAIRRRMSSLNDSPYIRRLPSQNNSPSLR
ncbi:hypothetical protein H257_17632 [Aphanomyces astaci]|uniref:DDE Tnp4 domain-containing protein n=1 Tax=Aphanomyces astaci TaxID=112090 RepID=W4FFY1_APHAT|nr:hypothetical protein H257_17632 [Aphanomyces astaci]ETV65746.1 hypothetical protein H257_17632 [Aphanomyces astaci]|eukprot:XP_009844798.1 hypothetical protein H257_17632 [Aphanomyces astaci]